MSFQAYYLTPSGELRKDLNEEEVAAAYKSGEGLLWVDVADLTEADGAFMNRAFGFHRLAIEDCVSPAIHRPKVDDFGDYLFIIVHGINHASEADIVETAELGVFIGVHFVVTAHSFPLLSVDSVKRLAQENGMVMKRGSEFLAHAVIDALIDNILPTIDAMGERTEQIEEDIIRNPHHDTLDSILKLKRSTLRLHRVVAPQREVLNRLSRGEFPIIGADAQIFYRDVYDHVARIEDLNQSLRDRVSDAISTYLSAVANRQNETMKLLSVVAAIFMPLTLLAGIYGMNFENMPELKWEWGYFAILGIIGTVIVVLLWVFWARSWIQVGRRKVLRWTPLKVDPRELMNYVDQLEHVPGWGKVPRPHLKTIHPAEDREDR